jgi:glycosyltransferase involved in cell wall biosynthesis
MNRVWGRRAPAGPGQSPGLAVPPPDPITLFSSSTVAGDIRARLGESHYSYHFAAEKFSALLTRHGLAPVPLAMPEYYASRAAFPPPPPPGAWIHLIFRSTEQIRLLKPATANIACFAWEFPVMKTETLPDEHPFLNQRAMLALCDEVWVPSPFTAGVLRAHGIDRVHVIPAPVRPPDARMAAAAARSMLADLPAAPLLLNALWPEALQRDQVASRVLPLAQALRRAGRGGPVFLAVLNPGDRRKNLDALIRGFHLFRRDHGHAVLIVKALVSPLVHDVAQVAGPIVGARMAPGTAMADDGILVINAFLTDAEMSALYCLADFYVCTSIAEGQNLPLLEAMAHGTVPVSTAATAMAAYIGPGNAVVIPAREAANDRADLAGMVAGRAFGIAVCGARDVRDSLAQAAGLGKTARNALGRSAREAALDFCAEDQVWPRLRARLAHHARTAA